MNIKTQLAGKSNALLTSEEREVLGIITCGKKEDITKKIVKAIKEHYTADWASIKKTNTKILNNVTFMRFSADLIEDGQETVRDFTIEVVATY